MCDDRQARWTASFQTIHDAAPETINLTGVDAELGATALAAPIDLFGGDGYGKRYRLKEGAEPPGGLGDFDAVLVDAQVGAQRFCRLDLSSLETVEKVFRALQDKPACCLILGGVRGGTPIYDLHRRAYHKSVGRGGGGDGGVITDVPRRVVFSDFDGVDGMPTEFGYHDPRGMVGHFLEHMIAEPFRGVSAGVQLSGSAGLKSTTAFKSHFEHMTDRPLNSDQREALFEIAGARGPKADIPTARATQPFFTCGPKIVPPGIDPLAGRRVWIHEGTRGDVVCISDDLMRRIDALVAWKVEKRRAATERWREESARNTDRGRDEIEKAYLREWTPIMRHKLGDGPGRQGYNKPLYSMVRAAVRNGERDFDILAGRLRRVVLRFAEERGDLQDINRERSVRRYLSDGELQRWFQNALSYGADE